jgi:hypothetical protein
MSSVMSSSSLLKKSHIAGGRGRREAGALRIAYFGIAYFGIAYFGIAYF